MIFEELPTKMIRLPVRGDGGDGGLHLVAHEICCKLGHARQVLHPLVRALWLPVADDRPGHTDERDTLKAVPRHLPGNDHREGAAQTRDEEFPRLGS